MSNTMTLGRISGIRIGIHWSVAFFAALVAYNLATFFYPEFAPGYDGLTYAVCGFLAASLLGVSILAHELGHARTAQNRGIGVEGITLWLLGGVAQMKSEATTPRDAFHIAAAGPAVSIALALTAGGLTFGLALLTGSVATATGLMSATPLVITTLGYLALINMVLALFNLLPALPLDGGRILQSWKWHTGGDREVATVDAAKIGRLFGFGLVAVGLVQLFAGLGNGILTIMLGFFVASRAQAERRQAERVIAKRTRQAESPFAPLFQLVGQMTAPASHRPAPVHVVARRIVPDAPIPVEARRIH